MLEPCTRLFLMFVYCFFARLFLWITVFFIVLFLPGSQPGVSVVLRVCANQLSFKVFSSWNLVVLKLHSLMCMCYISYNITFLMLISKICEILLCWKGFTSIRAQQNKKKKHWAPIKKKTQRNVYQVEHGLFIVCYWIELGNEGKRKRQEKY